MFWKKATAGRSRRSNEKVSRQTRTRRALIESLAARELLAADLSIIDEGYLNDFVTQLQSTLNDQVFSAEAILVGGQLATDDELQFLQMELGSRFSQLTLDSNSTVESVQEELERVLGFANSGGLLTDHVEITQSGPDGEGGFDEIRFRVPLQIQAQGKVALDLGMGDDSNLDIIAENQDAVNVALHTTLNLEFGVRTSGTGQTMFFVASDNLNELIVEVDATLDQITDARGRMGVFLGTFSTPQAVGDFDSNYHAIYTVDLQQDSPADDGNLYSQELHRLKMVASVNGQGEVWLDASGSFLPDIEGLDHDSLINLTVLSRIHLTSTLTNANASALVLGDIQRVEFKDLKLDLGSFVRDFVDPTMHALQNSLQPIAPAVEFLTSPMPVVGEALGGASLLDALESVAPSNQQTKIRAAKMAFGLVQSIMDYETPGTLSGDGTLGSFTLKYEPSDEDDSEQEQEEKRKGKKDQEKEDTWQTPSLSDIGFEASMTGALAMPMLTQSALIGLLNGDALQSLLTFSLTVDLTLANLEATVPVIPGLVNFESGLALTAKLDLDVGYDASGIAALTRAVVDSVHVGNNYDDSIEENQGLLAKGFYFDDHNSGNQDNGSGDKAELIVSAKVNVGVSLGPDLVFMSVKGGVETYLQADFRVDLNDLPENRDDDGTEWVYDGRVRLDEINEIVAHDPTALVNASGSVDVGMQAFTEGTFLWWTIWEEDMNLFNVQLVNFDIEHATDGQIIQKSNLDNATNLGTKNADGTVVILPAWFTTEVRASSLGASRDSEGNVIPGREDIRVVVYDALLGRRLQTFRNVSRIFYKGDSRNDVFIASRSIHIPMELYGNSGDDVLVGSDGDDTIHGGYGSDRLSGNGGSDTIQGHSGVDILSGGGGNDALIGGAEIDKMFGGSGNDRMWGEGGSDEMHGGSGNDLMYGGADLDQMFGDEGDDQLRGGINNDTLHGGSGNDYLDGGDHNDTNFGEEGDDTLIGYTGIDYLYGGFGNDYLDGGDDVDYLFGEAGNDEVHGGNGSDWMFGDYDERNYVVLLANAFRSPGNDKLYGNSGFDKIYGGMGSDTIDGGAQDDIIYGGGGDDYLYGGVGQDTLYGDYYFADWFQRTLVYATFNADAGNDELHGGEGHDLMYGQVGNDRLYGESGNDKMYGEAGHDYLHGGTGSDYMYGGADNDVLDGGGEDLAKDYLYGGGGYDIAYVGISSSYLKSRYGYDFWSDFDSLR